MKPHLPTLLLTALLGTALCTHAADAVNISQGADLAPYSLTYSTEGYISEYTLNLVPGLVVDIAEETWCGEQLLTGNTVVLQSTGDFTVKAAGSSGSTSRLFGTTEASSYSSGSFTADIAGTFSVSGASAHKGIYSTTTMCGGAIKSSSISLTGGDISFSDNQLNSATANQSVWGGALGTMTGTNVAGPVSIQQAGSISFTGNKVSNTGSTNKSAFDLAVGGAISGSTVSIDSNTGTITFSNNSAHATKSNSYDNGRVKGGAIFGTDVSLCDNTGLITFSGNSAKADNNTQRGFGGAVYAGKTLTMSRNAAGITFSGNSAGLGGALHAGAGGSSSVEVVTLADNGQISFASNAAYDGGAIYLGYSNAGNLTFSGNDGVLFEGNTASNSGGAIFSNGGGNSGTLGEVYLNNNKGDVIFSNNSAGKYGGAIRGNSGSDIQVNGNTGLVQFIGNKLSGSSLYGGAISADARSTVSLSNNKKVDISDNSISSTGLAWGGAVAMYWSSSYYGDIAINGNTEGVSITGNSASSTSTSSNVYGGALNAKVVDISNNGGLVDISGNKVVSAGTGKAQGAAIWVQDKLNITGNEKVELRGNVQQNGSETILRGVHMAVKSSTGALNLSAAAGGSIAFYDSLYAAPNSSYALTADVNQAYTDKNGHTQAATGTVLFSGKYAEQDLLAVKATASAAELEASRTSSVAALMNVHNGTLAVEDGAILKAQGFTVNSQASLSLREGSVQLLEGGLSLRSAEGTATLSGAAIAATGLSGTGGSMQNMWVESTGASFEMSGMDMQNVHFLASQATLALSDVSFDTASSFSVGAEGSIVLSNATLKITLPELKPEEGVLRVDLSNLFQCTVSGNLTVDMDVDSLVAAGYTGVEVDFGSNVNEDYSALTLEVEGNTYTGSEDNVVDITLPTVPEPATSTLSLLSLAALAFRRRRG